ncbi:hypothetical protein BCR36DRAFT_414502 [Piromyces finnis]|uniref:DUF5614 domain-containing protein n=1 Tax=Piromyces finnis TaxID=1754191 RepID=A0A1Y1V219_9FUNG|nr:hypothetical protein BCR36DRAFT_414502 [Piromyces finnis]|eukprot:ORX45344.1 hypothetical protein BCR36DRAFT_414502 [Piromyces finnis]
MNDTSNEKTNLLINTTKKLIENADFLIKGFQKINKNINKNYIFVGKSLKDQEQKGINKLITELKSEKKYLTKLLQNPENIQPTNIYCSNISYYSAVFQVAISEKNVTGLYEPVTYFNTITNTKETIRIDVISNNGLHWIKVKSRNLGYKESKLDNASDNKDIVEKETQHLIKLLQKFKNASKQNLIHYKKPKVLLKTVTYSSNENTTNITKKDDSSIFQKVIEELKISMEHLEIKNPLYDDLKKFIFLREIFENNSNSKFNNILRENDLFSDVLFLDVTALIAIVSDLSNLPCQSIPIKSIKPINSLYQQYLDEISKEIPSFMPLLYSLLYVDLDKNKINEKKSCLYRKMVTCITAVERLWKIVKIIAGPRELLRMINLFDDDTELSRMKELKKEMIMIFNQKFNQDNKYNINNNDSNNYYDYLGNEDSQNKEEEHLNYNTYNGLPKWLPKVKVVHDQPSELFVNLLYSLKLDQKNKKKSKNSKRKNKSKEEESGEDREQSHAKCNNTQLHKDKKLKTQEDSKEYSSDKVNCLANSTDNSNTTTTEKNNDPMYENWFEIMDSTEIIFGTAEALHMTLITSNDKKVKSIITEWKKKNEQIIKDITLNNHKSKNQNDSSTNTTNTISTFYQKNRLNLSENIKKNIHNYNFSYWIHPPRSLIEVRAFSN